MPSLRSRQKDVLLLAGHFLEQNRRRIGLRGLRLDTAARDALLAYTWPGNVRELEHVISRAVLKVQAGQDGTRRLLTITADLLDLSAPRPLADTQSSDGLASSTEVRADPGRTLRQATDDFQIQLIQTALERHGDNQASAARELGMDRGNFSRLRKRLGI